MEGIVIFNKPRGIKSSEVINYFKKKTKNKVGHGGTLDPLASGLLIVGIGPQTRDLKFFLNKSKKTYIAEMVLGIVSSSYDFEGKLSFTKGELPTLDKIKFFLAKKEGESFQTPPLLSAIKIKGVPLYKLVRQQKIVDNISIPKRKIKIDKIEFLNYQEIDKENFRILFRDIKKIEGKQRKIAKVKFKTTVSSGTYIRSLVNDLGLELGCGACLANLERIEICIEDNNFFEKYGQKVFSIDEALNFANFEDNFFELQARVFGFVQGVNFRFSTFKLAKELNLTGWVKNKEDGSVQVLAQGREESLQKLISFLKKGPPLAKVKEVKIIFHYPSIKFKDFSISY